MTKKINDVTTNKSIEVMNTHKFNHLLKLAKQNECIMTEFINFLLCCIPKFSLRFRKD